jgi:hypothetical protein
MPFAQPTQVHSLGWKPVKRGLVSQPEQWLWNSFRFYAYGEIGTVRVNFQEWPLKIKPRPPETFGGCQLQSAPPYGVLFRKTKSSFPASSSGSRFTSTFQSGTSCVISRTLSILGSKSDE